MLGGNEHRKKTLRLKRNPGKLYPDEWQKSDCLFGGTGNSADTPSLQLRGEKVSEGEGP